MRTNLPFVSLALPLLVAASGLCSGGPAKRASAETKVDRLYLDADKFFHDGDYYSSIRCQRQIIALDPAFIAAYTNSAWLLWSMGRETAALALLERGREANPDDCDIPLDIGFYHYQGARYGLAATEFARAAELGGTDKMQRMLAHSLEKKGDLPGALQVWEALHLADPQEPVVNRHRERLQAALTGPRGK